jgi:tRNA modification GTPase
MHGNSTDTITAIATAPGRGGVGIVRVSGPAVPDIAVALLGRLPRPRFAQWQVFRDAGHCPIDSGLALYFAPRLPVNRCWSCTVMADRWSWSS